MILNTIVIKKSVLGGHGHQKLAQVQGLTQEYTDIEGRVRRIGLRLKIIFIIQ